MTFSQLKSCPNSAKKVFPGSGKKEELKAKVSALPAVGSPYQKLPYD